MVVGAAEVAAGAAEDPGAVAFGSRGFRRAGAMNRGAAAGFTAGNPKSSEQVFQPAAQAAGFLLGRAMRSFLPVGTAASAADKARTSDRTKESTRSWQPDDVPANRIRQSC